MKPLAVDLCCGLGGWSTGLIAEGWDVVGFDIERHCYGADKYPAQLVLQDILTLDGRQFKGKVALIVASPPCQKYSYMAMPWKRAKVLAQWYRDEEFPERIVELNALFDACKRIGREAECPVVIENVCGAQPWVGSANWRYGSFYLWGDVPALMPIVRKRPAFKGGDRNIGRASGSHEWNTGFDVNAVKVPGLSWSGSDKPGYKAQAFNGTAEQRLRATHREISSAWRNKQYDQTAKMQIAGDGIKNGGDWFNTSQPSYQRRRSSKSTARKAASAHIAKIPIDLSRWIAKAWHP